jgi:hypothetical protein
MTQVARKTVTQSRLQAQPRPQASSLSAEEKVDRLEKEMTRLKDRTNELEARLKSNLEDYDTNMKQLSKTADDKTQESRLYQAKFEQASKTLAEQSAEITRLRAEWSRASVAQTSAESEDPNSLRAQLAQAAATERRQVDQQEQLKTKRKAARQDRPKDKPEDNTATTDVNTLVHARQAKLEALRTAVDQKKRASLNDLSCTAKMVEAATESMQAALRLWPTDTKPIDLMFSRGSGRITVDGQSIQLTATDWLARLATLGVKWIAFCFDVGWISTVELDDLAAAEDAEANATSKPLQETGSRAKTSGQQRSDADSVPSRRIRQLMTTMLPRLDTLLKKQTSRTRHLETIAGTLEVLANRDSTEHDIAFAVDKLTSQLRVFSDFPDQTSRIQWDQCLGFPLPSADRTTDSAVARKKAVPRVMIAQGSQPGADESDASKDMSRLVAALDLDALDQATADWVDDSGSLTDSKQSQPPAPIIKRLQAILERVQTHEQQLRRATFGPSQTTASPITRPSMRNLYPVISNATTFLQWASATVANAAASGNSSKSSNSTQSLLPTIPAQHADLANPILRALALQALIERTFSTSDPTSVSNKIDEDVVSAQACQDALTQIEQALV